MKNSARYRHKTSTGGRVLLSFVLCCTLVYAVGKALLHSTEPDSIALSIAALGGLPLLYLLPGLGPVLLFSKSPRWNPFDLLLRCFIMSTLVLAVSTTLWKLFGGTLTFASLLVIWLIVCGAGLFFARHRLADLSFSRPESALASPWSWIAAVGLLVTVVIANRPFFARTDQLIPENVYAEAADIPFDEVAPHGDPVSVKFDGAPPKKGVSWRPKSSSIALQIRNRLTHVPTVPVSFLVLNDCPYPIDLWWSGGEEERILESLDPRYDRFIHPDTYTRDRGLVNFRIKAPPGETAATILLKMGESGKLAEDASVRLTDVSATNRADFWRYVRREHFVGDTGDIYEVLDMSLSMKTHLVPCQEFVVRGGLGGQPAYTLANPPLHHCLAIVSLVAFEEDLPIYNLLYLMYVFVLLIVCVSLAEHEIGPLKRPLIIPMVIMLVLFTTFVRPSLEAVVAQPLCVTLIFISLYFLLRRHHGYFLASAVLAGLAYVQGLPLALAAVILLGVFFRKQRKEALVLSGSVVGIGCLLLLAKVVFETVVPNVVETDMAAGRIARFPEIVGRGMLGMQQRGWHIEDWSLLALFASAGLPAAALFRRDRMAWYFLANAGVYFLIVALLTSVRSYYAGYWLLLCSVAGIRSLALVKVPLQRGILTAAFASSASVCTVLSIWGGADFTKPRLGIVTLSKTSPVARENYQYDHAFRAIERGDVGQARGFLLEALRAGRRPRLTCQLLGIVELAGESRDEVETPLDSRTIRVLATFWDAAWDMTTQKENQALESVTALLREDPQTVFQLLPLTEDQTAGERGRRANSAIAHYLVGAVLSRQGDLPRAEAHLLEAVSLRPDNYFIHQELGTTLLNLGKPREAVVHLRKALELFPESVSVANNLAWILATSSDAALRNGEEAVRLAQKASRRADGNDPEILDTLAAAYAEASRFSEAVETAGKAVDMARSQGRELLVADIESRLPLYLAGKPFHQGSLEDPRP